MKKQNLLTRMLLLCALIVGSTSGWAAEGDPDWSATLDNSSNLDTSKKTYTVDKDHVWTYDVTVAAGSPSISIQKYSGTSGIRFGDSGSKYYNPIVLSTTAFNDVKVTKVAVYVRHNGSKVGTLTVKQGDITVGTAKTSQSSSWITVTSSTDKKGNGGTLSIKYEVAQAVYINKIDVWYEASDPIDPTLSFPESSYNATLGTSFSSPILTNNSDGALTYSSSNTNVATVTNTGVVTLKACGTTRITANTAASSAFNAGSAYYDLNVNAVAAPTITFDGTEYVDGSSVTKKAGKSLTFSTSAPDAEIWYTTDGTTPDATAATPVGTKYTSALTVNATTTYKVRTYVLDVNAGDVQSSVVTFTANITTEKETPTFSFASTSENITYGNDFTEPVLTNTSSETPAYESSNTSVATVDTEGNVTILAVGTTTISASVDENEDYKAANASYTLTVNENTSASGATAGNVELFNESMSSYTGSSDGNAINTSSEYLDEDQWSSFTQVYPGKNGTIKLGSKNNAASMVTKSIALTGNGTITYKVQRYDTSNTGSLTISVTGATATGDVSVTGTADWVSKTISLTNGTGNVVVTFATGNGSQSARRIRLDDIIITQEGASTINYTVPTSGWGTFCSPYKLDLDNEETEVTAYAVTGFDAAAGTITFKKTTGVVPAKTPLVIKGEAGAKKIAVDQTAATGTAPAGNLLTGYLSPTYYDGDRATNTVFGLSNGNFHKIKTGNIPANRAVLSMSTSEADKVGAAEGRFTFVFVDDEDGLATGINTAQDKEATNHTADIFDLQGRRVAQPTKGLYIVNGKKVIIK